MLLSLCVQEELDVAVHKCEESERAREQASHTQLDNNKCTFVEGMKHQMVYY